MACVKGCLVECELVGGASVPLEWWDLSLGAVLLAWYVVQETVMLLLRTIAWSRFY